MTHSPISMMTPVCSAVLTILRVDTAPSTVSGQRSNASADSGLRHLPRFWHGVWRALWGAPFAAGNAEGQAIHDVFQERQRAFIAQLLDTGQLRKDEHGRLHFDTSLEDVDEQARRLMAEDVRLGIIQITAQSSARDSLVAAADPEDTRYLYFVSRNDGSHVFAETLREHNRNVTRWQKQYWRKRWAEQRQGG